MRWSRSIRYDDEYLINFIIVIIIIIVVVVVNHGHAARLTALSL